MKKPYIKKYGKLDGFTVYLVDGEWIRDHKDIEFTNFDQHLHKKYIPKNEVWVDKGAKSNEIGFWAKSAVREAMLMEKGESYGKALTEVDKEEKAARRTDKHEKVTEKLLGKVGPLSVFLVSGEAVRDDFDIDFTEGGHSNVYKWIPKNEVWIDDDLKPKERKYVLLHEIHEYNLMKKGMKYEKAHHSASRVELLARRSPSRYDGLFRKEATKLGGKGLELDGKEAQHQKGD